MLSEWWQGSRDVLQHLPLMLTAIRGESLGHLPPEVRGGFAPREAWLEPRAIDLVFRRARAILQRGTYVSVIL